MDNAKLSAGFTRWRPLPIAGALLITTLLTSACADAPPSSRGAGVGAALGSGIALATGAGAAGVIGGGLIGGAVGYAGGWAAGGR